MSALLFGDLYTLYDMSDYNSKYKLWKLENYPFIPDQF